MRAERIARWPCASEGPLACDRPGGRIVIVDEAIAYAEAWAHQVALHRERVSGTGPDTVLVLEHRPVYTLGRRTAPAHWGGCEEALRRFGAEVHLVNRGGSVTYHGPGQIVLYPILRLTDHARGPKQFVRLMEEVVLRLLRQWGISGKRIEQKPGVWVEAEGLEKIASIGIRVERGVTLHGFSLNVDLDLTPFRLIQPCGLPDCRPTSMAALRQARLRLHEVKHQIANCFSEVFSVEWPIETLPSLTPSTLAR